MSDPIHRLKVLLDHHRDSRHVPEWESFFKPELHKEMLKGVRTLIRQIRSQDGGKEAAELMESAVDLYLEAVRKKDIIFTLLLDSFFQMIIYGTVPGYIGVLRQHTAAVMSMIVTIQESESKGIILKN